MVELRDAVVFRAQGHCEAMVELPRARARCGRMPVEDHHLLTRARGGDILDRIGELYHHIALCRHHHIEAHSPGGRASGLLIDGYVTIEAGRIVYIGDDTYLQDKYGKSRVEQWTR